MTVKMTVEGVCKALGVAGTEELKQYIRDRIVEEGDCWIWSGRCSSQPYPHINVRRGGGENGSIYFLAARVAFAAFKERMPKHKLAGTCGSRKCINPDHKKDATHVDIGKMAAKRGAFNTLKRRAKLAEAAQQSAFSKLNMKKVREIRDSDESDLVLADRYNVSRATIFDVRANRTWREYTGNPFAQLMR